MRKKKIDLKLSSLFAVLCCTIGLFFNTTSTAQTTPASCTSGCTSNDVQITGAYLSDASGVQLTNYVCGSNVSVYLTLQLTTNTPRVGVSIYSVIKTVVNGTPTDSVGVVSQCFGNALSTTGSIVTFTSPINWTPCGSQIALVGTYTAWGTGNKNFCTGNTFQCGGTPSKCHSATAGEIIIIQVPQTGTASATHCSDVAGSYSSTFDLTALESTIISNSSNYNFAFYNVSSLPSSSADTSGKKIANPSAFSATVASTTVYAYVCDKAHPTACSWASVTLNIKEKPGVPSPTSNSPICAGSTLNLFANTTAGSYAWSGPGGYSSTDQNPSRSSATTAMSGTYSLIVTTNGCSSGSGSTSVTIDAVPTTATVGTGQNRCGSLTSLGLGGNTPSVGTGTWSKKSGPGTVSFSANANTPNATATVSVAGTYVFTWTIHNGACTDSHADITVNYYDALSAPSVCVIQPSLCGPATGKVNFTDLGAGYQYSINGTDWQDCHVFLNVAAGAATHLRVKNSAGCESTDANCNTICGSDPQDCASGITKASAPVSESISETTVKAYPNPFSDRVKFIVTTPIAGKGTLEVYNMMGQRVKTIYQGLISAGTQTFELSLPTQQIANLIYVLRVGNKKMSGKLLQINQ
ncbi:MAG TPA: T9SS type A sorting domain-containing protein [Chitinophagaceae bacterium]|jgi:hypothetical protein|nr:T9SS type A sorting domain-containing protein [Chitinophagaceae bacterium]